MGTNEWGDRRPRGPCGRAAGCHAGSHLVDDGAGFDLHAEHEGFGLVGMKERLDHIGGQFIVRSLPGQGTEIQIILNNPNKPKPHDGGEYA